VEGQYTANDWSKYASFTPTQAVAPDAPLLLAEVQRRDIRAEAWDAAQKVKAMLAEYRISVPGGVDLELSHHYGIERFHEFGLTLLTIVNRGYCKKLLVCLPGQRHPEQFHRQKEETFHILHGEVELTLNGQTQLCRAGEVVHIEPEVRHEFFSHGGAIIEEISSTHFANDSFYTDPAIHQNANRKTLLTYWMV
ncbi:MAG: hypothetical protein RIR00_2619, partial [Pseudomonadota bacterium]